MRSLKNRKGFTLIELVIVIAILAIMAVIAVPQFKEYSLHNKARKGLGVLREVAIEEFKTTKGFSTAYSEISDKIRGKLIKEDILEIQESGEHLLIVRGYFLGNYAFYQSNERLKNFVEILKSISENNPRINFTAYCIYADDGREEIKIWELVLLASEVITKEGGKMKILHNSIVQKIIPFGDL